jgi:hypothetical protein
MSLGSNEFCWAIWRTLLLRTERIWGDSINMGVREVDYNKWFELSQDRIYCRILVLALLKRRILLPWSWLNSNARVQAV